MFKLLKLMSCILIAFVLMVNLAFAQNSVALSLQDCIQIAVENNSQLKAAGFELDRAGANLTGSYATILPNISANLQSGRVITDRSTFINNEFVSASRNFHSLGVSFGQTVFDFGQNWNTIKQAKASFDARAENLNSTRQNIFATVKQRYIELLKANNLENEYRLAVERGKDELKRTQSMYEIGSVAQIDVYRQEVTLGADEINLINQSNIVKIAQGNLNVAMGREPETPITIKDIEPSDQIKNYTLEEAYSIAENNSPQLRQFEYDMKSANYGLKMAKGSFLPSIAVGGSYSNTGEKPNQAYSTFGKDYQLSLGLQLRFNIFNGFSDKAAISRQSANYSIANENWIDTRRQLNLEVKQAFLNHEAYNNIAKINEKRLRSAEEEYRLAQERYRVGAGTQLEVTQAQVSLTSARVQLVSTKFDAMIAQAQLEAAMGIIERDNVE